MKKLLLLGIMVLLLSGCSVVYIHNQSIYEIVDSILVDGKKLKSISLEGYSYFLPQGVVLSRSDHQNSILYYNHKKMYLYVDLVSYYYKEKGSYQTNPNSYYSLPIDRNGYQGYLEITKIDDHYFIEFMYRYSKLETYVLEEDLNKTVTVMAYILNSIEFNDSVLDSLVGEKSLDTSSESFNIFKPSGAESDFLDFVEQYDDGRTESKDEDILDIEENME